MRIGPSEPARMRALVRWTAGTCPSTITLSDPLGRKLERRVLAPAAGQLSVELEGFPRGCYLITIGTCMGARTLLLRVE